MQGTQSTPMSDQLMMSYSALVDQVIRYPHLQFYAASPSEALSRFGPKATPLRMLSMDLSIIEMCQKRSGTKVDFAGYIRSNAPQRSLFHTALHPNGEITAMMVRSFVQQLPGDYDYLLGYIEWYLRQSEGINCLTYHPVSQSLLNELGFDWGESYDAYRSMLEARRSGDWGALIDREAFYVSKFPNDTFTWMSLMQAHAAIGTLENGKRCLSSLLDLSPGYLYAWTDGLGLLHKHNDQTGVLELIQRAKDFFIDQRMLSQVMAYFCLSSGRYEEAEAHGRNYHSRTPDRADALVPWLKALLALGRTDEVKRVVDYEVSIAGVARMADIRANFSGWPDLKAYLPAE
ncbi:hypothetical protein BHMPCIPO_01851 [Ensifer sesbaniae]|nr:hypothetical protein [Ensifer sesbaniae]